jgi:hypothetical protein
MADSASDLKSTVYISRGNSDVKFKIHYLLHSILVLLSKV